jgi:hypothetical protein
MATDKIKRNLEKVFEGTDGATFSIWQDERGGVSRDYFKTGAISPPETSFDSVEQAVLDLPLDAKEISFSPKSEMVFDLDEEVDEDFLSTWVD